MTPYDWLLARRALALGSLLGILAVAVMIATDETTITLGGRLGRFASVAPIVGAGATFLSVQQARSRGEIRALEAAGASPSRACLGMLVGGTVLGALGPILAMVPAVDLSTLFPTVAPIASHWTMQDGTWFDVARGIVVQATGDLAWARPAGASAVGPSRAPRALTAFALALAAVGCPLWTAAQGGGARKGLVAAAVAGAAILAFHLVAAGRLAPAALALPPAFLLVDAWMLFRGRRWC